MFTMFQLCFKNVEVIFHEWYLCIIYYSTLWKMLKWCVNFVEWPEVYPINVWTLFQECCDRFSWMILAGWLDWQFFLNLNYILGFFCSFTWSNYFQNMFWVTLLKECIWILRQMIIFYFNSTVQKISFS